MRTNIEIDDDLMSKAMSSSGAATKKALVEEALQLLVRNRAQLAIRKLRGIGGCDPDYDYKTMRANDMWSGSSLIRNKGATLTKPKRDVAIRGGRKKAA